MSWLEELYAQKLARTPKRENGAPECAAPTIADPAQSASGFTPALRAKPSPSVIAEIKFASPSQGAIRPRKDVEAVAESYAAAGAAALSVLTEEKHFGGHLSFIERAKRSSGLPILRKDFLATPCDIAESQAAGADGVLLIARFLHRETLAELICKAREFGLSALVEVHGEEDLEKTAGLPVEIIGVNHRNLETLCLDMALSARLAPLLPAGAIRVAESGISTGRQLRKMAALGYDAVLVGTAFMQTSAPGKALARLIGEARDSN